MDAPLAQKAEGSRYPSPWPVTPLSTYNDFNLIYFAGYKTFTNEFIAYERLSVLIANTETFNNYNGSYVYINDDIYLEDNNATLVGGVMEVCNNMNQFMECKLYTNYEKKIYLLY